MWDQLRDVRAAIAILFFSVVMGFGQAFTLTDPPMLSGIGAAPAAPVPGPPGLLTVVTNSNQNKGGLTNTITVSGNHTLMVWTVAFYANTSTLLTPRWNGSSNGVVFIGEVIWYQAAFSARLYFFYLPSPAAGTGTSVVEWQLPTFPSEQSVICSVWTNASGTFNGYTTNYQATGVAVTNLISSSTNEVILSSVAAASSSYASPGAGQTLLKAVNCSTVHNQTASWQAGTGSTVSNTFTYGGSVTKGMWSGRFVGF